MTATTTNFESIVETMLPALLQGDRAAVRTLVARALAAGVSEIGRAHV